MSNFKHYNDIVELISREVVNELSSHEMEKLKAWIKDCPENELLYNRIKNSGNFKVRNIEYQKIDIPAGWEAVSLLIENKRRVVLFKKIFTYAAAIILPIMMIAGGIYFSGSLANKNKITTLAQVIQPGSTKAVLILNDGKTVLLDSANVLSITEKDGTLIEKTGGKLNYSNPLNEKADQMIHNTITIPRGGEYNLVLADGTRVYLNAMSSFRYPVKFGGKHRVVELSGEAYFEVKKDASRPFIVKTAAISIEVLGTSFNLNAYDNTERIVTTLIEGSVKINSQETDQSRLLRPDEQAIFQINSGQIDIKKVDVNLYTAWKNGNLTFYDSRLEDIMITLTRWYSADVLYKNESVKNLRFSGNLNRYGDINQILDILRSTGKINIEINNSTILFSKRN
jgi:hypothetical protein